MTHSITNFRDNIDTAINGNPYGYLTMWNGHGNGFGGHHISESLEDTIKTMYETRTAGPNPWSNYDALIFGSLGIGGKVGQAGTNNNPIWIDYPIAAYVDTKTITLTGNFKFAFDPEDNNYGKFRIVDPATGDVKYPNLEIQFGEDRYPAWPADDGTVTTVIFEGTPNLQDVQGFDDWVLRRPNKTITQWLKWWGGETGSENQGSFLFILNDVLDGQ